VWRMTVDYEPPVTSRANETLPLAKQGLFDRIEIDQVCVCTGRGAEVVNRPAEYLPDKRIEQIHHQVVRGKAELRRILTNDTCVRDLCLLQICPSRLREDRRQLQAHNLLEAEIPGE